MELEELPEMEMELPELEQVEPSLIAQALRDAGLDPERGHWSGSCVTCYDLLEDF